VIADTYNNRIRVVAGSTATFYGVAMTAGDIYTIAGNGTGGYSGNGGAGDLSRARLPQGIAVDSAGNVVIADTNNDRIRAVAETTGTYYGTAMTAGDIYTIAGNGSDGYSGDGGPATSALYFASDVAVDGSGNVLIADTDNDRIRVVAGSTATFYGTAMTAGDIYTIAGNGTYGYSGDGGPGDLGRALRSRRCGRRRLGQRRDRRYRRLPAPGGGGKHRHLLRHGDDGGRHLHHRRQRGTALHGRRRAGHLGRSLPARRCGRRRLGQRGDRRHRRLPHPSRGGKHRHLLRHGDDSGRHLHHRRQRDPRLHRRRRAGDLGQPWECRGCGPRRLRQRAHRRRFLRSRPGGGGEHRHLLRQGDDGGRHLHHRRHRVGLLLGRRRVGDLGHALLPRRCHRRQLGQRLDRRHVRPTHPGGRRPAPAPSTAKR
jgi:hypothetical protein